MYTDPSKIREHVIKVRLNDSEAALIDALVNYTGEQKAALMRSLILEQAHLVLGVNSQGFASHSEGPLMASRSY